MIKLIMTILTMLSLTASASTQPFSQHIPKDLGNIFIHRVPKAKGGIRGVLRPKPIFPEEEAIRLEHEKELQKEQEKAQEKRQESAPQQQKQENKQEKKQTQQKKEQKKEQKIESSNNNTITGEYSIIDLEESPAQGEPAVQSSGSFQIMGSTSSRSSNASVGGAQSTTSSVFDIPAGVPVKEFSQPTLPTNWTWEVFPGASSAQSVLYRVNNPESYPYAVAEVYGNGSMYFVESITELGRIWSNAQIGDRAVFDGQTYEVKAIEYPNTSVDSGIDYIPGYTQPNGVYKPAENTRSLAKHNNYIQTLYYSPTAVMVQTCMDNRVYNDNTSGVFTNKIIILDLVHGGLPKNTTKGVHYPLRGQINKVYNNVNY